ncbi:phenylalanine--tRNA ligase beta subunit-related protein [Shigella flexneri]
MLNQLPLVEPEMSRLVRPSTTRCRYRWSAGSLPRYLGRVVKGINVKAPTPLWMKERLRGCRNPSIDAVVDVTNYVLLGLGRPIHALDKDRIEGGVVVRMAKRANGGTA